MNPETAQEVYVQPLEITTIHEAVEWSHRNCLDIELYSSTTYFAEHENWSTRTHKEFFDVTPVFGDYENLLGRERIVKIGTVATNAEEALKIQEFKSGFTGRLRFTLVRTPAYPGIDFINVVSPLVSKGKAVSRLAAYLGVSKEEIVAIGDGSNDVPLLSAAGLAIAMPHSPEELKAVADYVTLGVEENGVAAAVKKFILPD